MKRKLSIRSFICTLFFIILSNNVALAASSTPDINNPLILQYQKTISVKAASSILVEAERGQVLYSKQSNNRLHISAACKLMTVLIAVESGNLNDSVTISKDSIDSQGSALSLEIGEKYTLGNLLYGIMLTSANDAAKSVAEHTAGDINKFVGKMNEMASKLNMKNTHFTNPTGLYDEKQYTTAYDISLLIKYAINNIDFKRIFAVQAKPWIHGNGKSEILTSPNKLFWSYDGVNGGKTGYNNIEQQSIITTASRNNMELICILLDSPSNDLFNDATSVLDYGFNNFKKSILAHKDEQLKTVKIQDKTINLISNDDVYYVHPIGENYIKKLSVTTDTSFPIKKNKLAGNARYELKDSTIIDVGLYPETDFIPSNDLFLIAKNKLLENKNILYLIFFLLSIEVILLIAKLSKLILKFIKKISGKNTP